MNVLKQNDLWPSKNLYRQKIDLNASVSSDFGWDLCTSGENENFVILPTAARKLAVLCDGIVCMLFTLLTDSMLAHTTVIELRVPINTLKRWFLTDIHVNYIVFMLWMLRCVSYV